MDFKPLTVVGILLIVFGLVLVALPLIARFVPSVERLPWYIVWVYHRNGFYFATSPLLIAVSLLWILVQLISRYR